jgi:hypothetical protein
MINGEMDSARKITSIAVKVKETNRSENSGDVQLSHRLRKRAIRENKEKR